jgi:3-oxoacyl-[acyl-carrier protein] reductase
MSRVVVITGTRKGIGRSLCSYFLEQGDFVYGCSRRESDFHHENYVHYTLDVSDELKVVKMINGIYKAHKRIDILLNNAGAAAMNHTFLTPYLTAQKMINTNYFGTFLMCREVGKLMLKNRSGRIINFTTVAVPLNLQGELVYSASKSAIEQLTRVLAAEIGNFGITVNAIGPTPIQTDLIKNVPKDKIDSLIQSQSIKRIGGFDDVLNVVKFFISQDSSFINGQIIYLGGIN